MNIVSKPLCHCAHALALMLLLAMSGCSTSTKRSEMPAWIYAAQIVPGYITAVGHAHADPEGNVARQRRLARLIAEGELAENLLVITSTDISTSYPNQRKKTTQDDQQQSHMVVDSDKVRQLAEWTDPVNNSLYVLIAYPRARPDQTAN